MKKELAWALIIFAFAAQTAFNQSIHNSIVITPSKAFYNVSEEIEVVVNATGVVGFQVFGPTGVVFVDQFEANDSYKEKFSLNLEGAYLIRASDSKAVAEKAILVGENGLFVEGVLKNGFVAIKGYAFKNRAFANGYVAIVVLNENNGVVFVDQQLIGQNGAFETYFEANGAEPVKVLAMHGDLRAESNILVVE